MSVGLAVYPKTSSNMHALIKLADIAMYKAKKNKIAHLTTILSLPTNASWTMKI
ncbi:MULTISPECIES: diguanylate cyclase domain-containing protein [Alteromonas]|uniref:diguanylate cyclase domain-containing protein n=1 Tax=Alteromonas TaxID=226 RepID=UPI002356F8AD|nr:diguanylate cyclase [Alteromonas australica]